MKKRVPFLVLPFLSALPAAMIGSLVMKLHHVSTSASLQNFAALLVGGLISCVYLSLSHRTQPKTWHGYTAILVCAGMLGCTFLDSGTDGVHRWIRIGPIALHAAFLFVPIAVAGIDQLFRAEKQPAAYASALLIGVLLFFQPDASMSSAFLLSMIPTLWHDRKSRAMQRIALGILIVFAAVSWLCLKSPEPVAHVEGILSLACASGWGIGLASLVSLLIPFCPFIAGMRRKPLRIFCAANMLFYAALLAASCTGLFPVPILGSGVSPVLGYLISATSVMQRLKACNG